MSSFALPSPQLNKTDPGFLKPASPPSYAFSAYSPAWTSSGTQPALGNGSLTGTYVKIGNVVVGRLLLTMGSTTTYGTGTYALSLPVAAVDPSPSPVGNILALDAGVASYAGLAIILTSTTVQLDTPASPAAAYSAIVPFTFGSGDQILFNFIYQAS